MNLSDVLTAIAKGELDGDDNAKAIVSAINARSRAISAAAGAAVTATLKTGDRVRITGDVRPASMRGSEGVVTAFNRSKVSVRLDGDIVDTRIPPSILTKIADKVEESADEATARLIAAFKAENDQYPQYEGKTDGAVAVPLRKNWKHRGINLAKGTFVLLMKEEPREDGFISVWHPHLLCTTLTDPSGVVLPRGATR